MADPTPDIVDDPEGEEPTPDPIGDRLAALETQRAADQTAYQQSLGALQSRYDNLEGRYDAVAASVAAGNKLPEREALPPEITDEAIAEALENGEHLKAAKLLKQQMAATSRRDTRVLHDTVIAPLVGQVQNVGYPTMERLTKRVVEQSFDEGTKALYDKHKDGVARRLESLNPELRMNPEAIEQCLALEVGASVLSGGYQKAVREEAERIIRSGSDPTIKAGARGADHKAVDYTALFGAEAAAAAEEKGGFDAWASARGYDDMADYCRKNGVTLQ